MQNSSRARHLENIIIVFIVNVKTICVSLSSVPFLVPPLSLSLSPHCVCSFFFNQLQRHFGLYVVLLLGSGYNSATVT